MIYAEYAKCALLSTRGSSPSAQQASSIDTQQFPRTLEILRQGERIDPENGFYSLMAAALLAQGSSAAQEDPSTTYDRWDWNARVEPWKVYRIEVTDPQAFQAALEDFHRGLAKPHLRAYTVEMLSRRLAALPPPVRMIQYLHRLSMQVVVLLPDLDKHRALAASLLAYSRVLASQGDSQGR